MKAGIYGGSVSRKEAVGGIDSLTVVAVVAGVNFALAIVAGGLMLAFNSLEVYALQLLSLVALSCIVLAAFVGWRLRVRTFALVVLAALVLASAVVVSLLPLYLHGAGINGIVHRSLISGLLALAVAVPCSCYSVYYALGATPRANDISRYPLLLFLAGAALVGFGMMVFYVVKNGALHLDGSVVSMPFMAQSKIVETWVEGWPTYSTVEVKQVGMLNHIGGTLLLMGLTSLISLPIGASVGVFVHEYAGRALGGIINFSTTALRSISGIVLALTAISVINLPDRGTYWYRLLHGYGYDVNGVLQTGRSSFLLASAFISLLVIPIIARATQDGLSSLPADIKEGSLGLGASPEHTLFHLQLPWSLPNIITGLMLGCAEAAGALTIIFLISGTGEFGVSPLHETTSLAYLVFDCRYGKELGDHVQGMMQDYQYTAALVLVIMTLALTVGALLMKKRLEKRYKGAR